MYSTFFLDEKGLEPPRFHLHATKFVHRVYYNRAATLGTPSAHNRTGEIQHANTRNSFVQASKRERKPKRSNSKVKNQLQRAPPGTFPGVDDFLTPSSEDKLPDLCQKAPSGKSVPGYPEEFPMVVIQKEQIRVQEHRMFVRA
jgi:hypothetical protein